MPELSPLNVPDRYCLAKHHLLHLLSRRSIATANEVLDNASNIQVMVSATHCEVFESDFLQSQRSHDTAKTGTDYNNVLFIVPPR